MNADMPPFWTTYISVADADETSVAIKEDGGSLLVEPMDVMDVGRMAVALDPTGAVFSIWQPRSHIGAGIVNDVNTFCWNELMTRNPQRSVEFYGAVFGWTANILPDAGVTNYTEFHLGGRGIAGMLPMEGDTWPADMPNHWIVYFAVENCDDAVALVEELGGVVIVPPTEVPPGKFAVVKDPQGAVFSVIALHPAAA
jgi:predicted enzyme related to lactoylglutathione lyase